MKAKISLFAMFILIVGYIAAQSNVQIIDIIVSPIMEVDAITNLPIESDSEKLTVLCKINDLSEAQTVQILVGSTQNSGDILIITASIENELEIFYLVYNNENFVITNISDKRKLGEHKLISEK
jgi:hypothetical protein